MAKDHDDDENKNKNNNNNLSLRKFLLPLHIYFPLDPKLLLVLLSYLVCNYKDNTVQITWVILKHRTSRHTIIMF